MESSLEKIRGTFGADAKAYMRNVGTPILSRLTAELLRHQPENAEEFIIHYLSRSLKPTRDLSVPLAPSITLFHFNDVYNIEGQSLEPVGGAARFVHKVRSLKALESEAGNVEPLVIFSGDAFNPSLMSTITKGKQMIPVLNAAQVDVACMGNHDFDFGIENLESLTRVCDFPWLLSNVVFKPTGRNLAEGESYRIIERGGRRIGFIGLVESEWMATLSTIDEHDIDYEDFVNCARRLSAHLRNVEHVDAVVAITHMRVPNDERLANEAGEGVLDLICGGHDHHYDVKRVGPQGTYVCKSGTDFRDITQLTMSFDDVTGGVTVTDPERIVIDSSVPEDDEIKEVVRKFLGVLGSEMDKKIGHSNVPLDCRFQMIRTQETNIGNFITDIMRRGTDADIAILNSGTLRADSVIPAGAVLMKTMVSILPMVDETCVLEMSGEQIMKALENGVSMYPKLEGRFPQVSGLSFEFDAAKEPGERVLFETIKVGGKVIAREDKFSVVTKAYLAKGKDGYDVFKDCKILIDEESSPVLPTLVRNTFTELSILNGFKATRRGSVMKSAEKWKLHTFHETPEKKSMRSRVGTPKTTPRKDGVEGDTHVVEEGAANVHGVSHGIHPEIEGRIVCRNPAVIEIL